MVGMLTGGVAGLATVTPCAGCTFKIFYDSFDEESVIRPWAGFVIGLLASLISYGAVIIKTRVGWDDALDVWACHGVGGIIGSILLGVFAQKDVNGISGLIEGDGKQFGIQIAGAAIVSAWSVLVTVVLLLAINLVIKIRVPEEAEKVGLDLVTTADHGAYDTDREGFDLAASLDYKERVEFEFREDKSSSTHSLPKLPKLPKTAAPEAEKPSGEPDHVAVEMDDMAPADKHGKHHHSREDKEKDKDSKRESKHEHSNKAHELDP